MCLLLTVHFTGVLRQQQRLRMLMVTKLLMVYVNNMSLLAALLSCKLCAKCIHTRAMCEEVVPSTEEIRHFNQ